jgi:hypothetical protein
LLNGHIPAHIVELKSIAENVAEIQHQAPRL